MYEVFLVGLSPKSSHLTVDKASKILWGGGTHEPHEVDRGQQAFHLLD